MGKYSNVSATQLESAVNRALNELSRYSLNDVKNKLANTRVLRSSASSVVNDALTKVINSKSINGSIAKLKDKLNNLKSAAGYIKKYQEIEKQIEQLERKKSSSSSINTSVINQINSKKNTLKSYENQINNLLR